VRFQQFIAITCLALTCALASAHAEKRVALVIGNDRYANLAANEQLQKAVNDARSVGNALKSIGFDVIPGENLDRRALVAKLDELTQRLAPGDTALFFFSGHGVALDGVNYILPADVPDIAVGQETRLRREALDEPSIIAELTGRGVRIAVVVLDACRNNPFSRPGGRGVGGARGLAPPQQVQGVFSLYAAANGQTALDRLYDGDPNPNSVFSRVLVPALTRPGVDLATLAIEVREEVARVALIAGHAQQPAYYDQTVGGRVYLNGTPPAGGQPVAAAVSDAERTWGLVQNTASLAVLDDYIRRFGDVPIYGPLARARRDEVARQQTAAVAPPVPPAVPAGDPCGGPVTSSFPSRCVSPLTAAQERALKPKDAFRECENCPEMVVVPAGSFTMGSPKGEKDRFDDEGPQHVVRIGKPFAVDKVHVTVDQFAAFVGETGYLASARCSTFNNGAWNESADRSWRNPGFLQEGSHPVVCVSWDDANAYVDWLSKKTGKIYRILSEAEWEYAAHGRTSPGAYSRFWFGDDEKDLCRYGNGANRKARDIPGWNKDWTVASCNDGYLYTSPVGHFAPNAFGLYDMAGNAEQWTADCYHDGYNGAPADGSAWTEGPCSEVHVVRGGSWFSIPGYLRAAQRYKGFSAGNAYGFRVARTLTR
jgi:formylglycine-generating enzyme required for sulfatase activity/uncharacterized caspase-like protein